MLESSRAFADSDNAAVLDNQRAVGSRSIFLAGSNG
jgi:hypothetical protein